MANADRRTSPRRNKHASASPNRRNTDRRTDERRLDPRVPLELWMEEVAGDEVYFRRSGNVSEGGVHFDRAIPHTAGTMITLKFALPGESEMVVARGKVVNSAAARNGLGMRVKFVSVEGDGVQRIRRHLRTR